MNNKDILLVSIIGLLFVLSLTVTAGAETEIKAEDITINSLEEGQEIIAEENVYILYNNLEFTGGYAQINSTSGNMVMEDEIKIKSEAPAYVLTGNNLEGNLEEEKFEIRGKVELTGDQLKANSEIMNYNHQKQIIHMEQNLYLEYQDLQVEANEGDFDLEKEEITLRGSVKGNQNGRQFSGEKVSFKMEEGPVKIQGQARLMILNEETTEGEE